MRRLRALPRTTVAELLGVQRPPEWTATALCAQVDPDIFFPEKGGDAQPAKRVCGMCDVRAQCLAWVLARTGEDRYGIVAGLTPHERRVLRRRARAAA